MIEGAQAALPAKSPSLEKLLSNDFESIANLLSISVLASYLLGYDSAKELAKETIRGARTFNAGWQPALQHPALQQADFASDNDGNPTRVRAWLPYGKDEEASSIESEKIKQRIRFDVPPEEAIDYFKRKKIVTPKEFDKLSTEAKIGAFKIAGIYRANVLDAFKFEIEDVLATGRSGREAVKGFKEILNGDRPHKMLGDFHLETIWRTNMASAYGVGRRRSMEEVSELLPFWERLAVMDDRTRPAHRALHGVIMPADDPFWDEHYPPDGFNCRCTVIARLDMPEGYDQMHPNPETTIAYDEGQPWKAEVVGEKFATVDLTAVQFNGIPKSATLDKVLNSAAQKMKSTRVLNHTGVPQVVADEAKRLRLKRKENLVGWDADGKLIKRYQGNADEVEIPASDVARFKDGFDIHNHPAEKVPKRKFYSESFSDVDFVSFVKLNLKARYLVTRNYLYQIRRPAKGWSKNTEEKFARYYNREYAKIAREANELIGSGLDKKTALANAIDNGNHPLWQTIAKELKFSYRRFKITEL